MNDEFRNSEREADLYTYTDEDGREHRLTVWWDARDMRLHVAEPPTKPQTVEAGNS